METNKGFSISSPHVVDVLKKKMPWADEVMVRQSVHGFGIEIRVRKGNYATQMAIEDVDNPHIVEMFCERMAMEIKDAIGQGVIDGSIVMPRGNIAVAKEQVVEVDVPRLSLGDYAVHKVSDICEKITAPFRPRRKEAVSGSILPSKREPNNKAVNGDADKYYSCDGEEIKRKWYQIW